MQLTLLAPKLDLGHNSSGSPHIFYDQIMNGIFQTHSLYFSRLLWCMNVDQSHMCSHHSIINHHHQLVFSSELFCSHKILLNQHYSSTSRISHSLHHLVPDLTLSHWHLNFICSTDNLNFVPQANLNDSSSIHVHNPSMALWLLHLGSLTSRHAAPGSTSSPAPSLHLGTFSRYSITFLSPSPPLTVMNNRPSYSTVKAPPSIWKLTSTCFDLIVICFLQLDTSCNDMPHRMAKETPGSFVNRLTWVSMWLLLITILGFMAWLFTCCTVNLTFR